MLYLLHKYFSIDDEKINWGDLTSDFRDVLDSRRRSDAGIMTDEWIQNSQKDEPTPKNHFINRPKLFFLSSHDKDVEKQIRFNEKSTFYRFYLRKCRFCTIKSRKRTGAHLIARYPPNKTIIILAIKLFDYNILSVIDINTKVTEYSQFGVYYIFYRNP